MSVENIIRCSVWISSKVDNSNKIHVQRKCTINGLFFKKSKWGWSSSIRIEINGGSTYPELFFSLQIKQSTTYLYTNSPFQIKTIHKIRGFENCHHKMWLMAANIWFSTFNLVKPIGVILYFIYFNYLLNEHWLIHLFIHVMVSVTNL